MDSDLHQTQHGVAVFCPLCAKILKEAEDGPKAGEQWYVVLPGGVSCTRVQMTEVTRNTYLVAECTQYSVKAGATRYPKSGLQIIERVFAERE